MIEDINYHIICGNKKSDFGDYEGAINSYNIAL
jgi:hypothetical protein